MRTLVKWLISQDEKSKDEAIVDALEKYFQVSGKLLLLVGLVIIIAGLSTIYEWPYSVNIDALSNYIGVLFATVVAFAGSIVAISLAIQGLTISKEQNRHAITQHPEYQKGLDAAMAYARFKGVLLLLPFHLRALQKRESLDAKALASGADDAQSLKGLSKHLNELLDTTFITVFDRVAFKSEIDGGEDLQYLFLNRFSVLQSRQNLLRGVMLALKMIREVDDIVVKLYEKPFHSSETEEPKKLSQFPDYESYETEFKKVTKVNNSKLPNELKLNEIEFWFIQHVYAYANSSQKITYEDFGHLFRSAKTKLYEFANKIGVGLTDLNLRVYDELSFHTQESKTFISLEDSSLFKLVHHNREISQQFTNTFKRLSTEDLTQELLERDITIQLIITNAWDIHIARLLQTISLHQAWGKAINAKIIVLFDQVGQYKDSYNESYKHLLFSQHLTIWQFFRKLVELITFEMADQIDIPDISSIIFNTFRDDDDPFELMLKGATQNLKINDLYDDEEIKSDFKHKLNSVCSDHFEIDLNFSEKEVALIKHLALKPIFERPIYGFKYGFDGFVQPIAMPVLKNVEFMSYMTFSEAKNGELEFPDNLFVEWLIRPKTDQTSKDIYWVD